jgi:hypothetical protein
MSVNIKKEFVNLDRNNFQDVCDLVDKIMEDIKETMGIDYEMGLGLMQDYMVDLINPDLLDFDSSDS